MKDESGEETEWIRLQRLKADKQERENLIAAGKLVWVEDVERTTAETWQMVGNDLRHTLPVMVADRLTGRGIDPAILREAVRKSVDELVSGWKTDMKVESKTEQEKRRCKRKRGKRSS